MLKMEYLLEEAKELDLPQTKKRAILREYLQTIILNGIYKSNFARSMFFVGGTALRFFYKKRDNLFIASINFPAVMSEYGITNRRGGDIMIKIEVNKPEWHLSTESHVLSQYGYNFSAILMSKGALLSEKISALLSRKRGRYIYDILFMLRKKFPFDKEVLYANNIKEEPKNLILNYLSEISEKELKRLAEQVKPFLFREDDIELVLKAPQYGEKFLAKYK